MAKRMGHARIQSLINENNYQLETRAMLKSRKVKMHPADPTAGLITADTTFGPGDAGKIILIDASSAGNLTMTLPTGELGMTFTFMLGSDSHANSQILLDAGSGGNIRGISTGIGNSAFVDMNARTVGFGDAEQRGAMIEIVYIGNRWFIKHAICRVAMIEAFS